MEKNQLRQRLIGASVLAALAVIIVPFFLGDQPDMAPEHIASIPPVPEQIPGAEIPIDEGAAEMPVDEVTSDIVIDAVTPLPAASSSASPVPEKQPMLKAAPSTTTAGPVAWVVQLGSFSNERNAWALRDKLRSKGYHAFVERVSEDHKMVIRVRIGPELQRAKAEAVRQKLEKEMKIKGVVMVK